MLKLYAFLFIVAILSGVGYGAYYYYNDTQTRIATLRANNAKLETVNKQVTVEFEQYRDNVKEEIEAPFPSSTHRPEFDPSIIVPSLLSPTNATLFDKYMLSI